MQVGSTDAAYRDAPATPAAARTPDHPDSDLPAENTLGSLEPTVRRGRHVQPLSDRAAKAADPAVTGLLGATALDAPPVRRRRAQLRPGIDVRSVPLRPRRRSGLVLQASAAVVGGLGVGVALAWKAGPVAAGVMGVIVLLALMTAPRERIRALAVLVAEGMLVVLPAGIFQPLFGSSPAGQFVSPVAVVVFCAVAVVRHGALPRMPRAAWLYGLVLVIGVVATFAAGTVTPYPLTVVAVVLALLVTTGRLTPVERRTIVGGTILVALAVAACCLAEALVLGRLIFGDVTRGANPMLPGTIRAQAALGHPSVAGTVMAVGLCLVATAHGRTSRRVLVGSVLAAGCLTTGSTAVIVVAAGCLSLMLIGRGSRRRRAAGWVSLIAVLVWAYVGGVIFELLGADLTGSNPLHRLSSLSAVPALLTDRPPTEMLLGSGWGCAPWLYARGVLPDDGFHAIDNELVTVLAATGLLGLVLFGVFLALVLFRGRGIGRLGMLACVILFWSYDVLDWRSTAVLFAVLVALTPVRGGGSPPGPDPASAPTSPSGSGTAPVSPSGSGTAPVSASPPGTAPEPEADIASVPV